LLSISYFNIERYGVLVVSHKWHENKKKRYFATKQAKLRWLIIAPQKWTASQEKKKN